jgi:hypothetical protein
MGATYSYARSALDRSLVSRASTTVVFGPSADGSTASEPRRQRARTAGCAGIDEVTPSMHSAELQADVEEAAVENSATIAGPLAEDLLRRLGQSLPGCIAQDTSTRSLRTADKSCPCSPARARSAPAPPPPPEIATDCRRRSLRRLTTRNAGNLVRTPATRPHRVRDVSCSGVELAGRRPG